MNSQFNRFLIIGFRCTGKTSISPLIAQMVGFEFLDMDSLIEKEQNKTIYELTNNGNNWEKFREIELFKIKELLLFDNIVISAGGGLGVNNIKYYDNFTYGDLQREIILRSKDTLKILLTADKDIIRERLYNDKIKKNNDRPDLDISSSNIEEYIENNIRIMNERQPYYEEMADIVFKTNSNNVTENAKEILKLINQTINK